MEVLLRNIKFQKAIFAKDKIDYDKRKIHSADINFGFNDGPWTIFN
jgi:hypothetical protein